MVCKEDVVTWFKELTSSKRIDVMCSLLNMCLPFELRFLGTCLEDLGRRDFHDLRDTEIRANNSAELSELQNISDKRTQRKLALYLSLLKSCNHACTNGFYKILANLDSAEICTIINNSSSDENPLEELLLLYTLALNHPAFTYEQKAVFGNILVKLQDEENRLYSAKHSLGVGVVYVKSPVQPCTPCPSSEERQQHDVAIIGHCPNVTIPASHTGAGEIKGRSSLPPGLSVPPGLGLPPEQLTATSYVHVAFSSPGHQPIPAMPWHTGVGPLVMTGLCGTLPEVQGAGEVSPYPSSPLMSRQSSPSQSGSPSRAGSPRLQQQQQQPMTDRGQAFAKNVTSSRRDRSTVHSNSASHRQNCVESTVVLPTNQSLPQQHQSQPQRNTISRKSSIEPADTIKESIGKEIPNYHPNLQKYSLEELRHMKDEELKDKGLGVGSIHELRNILTKMNSTNGLCTVDKREGSGIGRRKHETAEVEQAPERKTQSAGPVMRRYSSVPVETGPMMFPPPPLLPQGAPCYTCIAVPVSSAAPARYHNQPQQFYCVNHHLRSLHLDGDTSRHCSNSSSASDSSSTSHSPPDTPSMPSAPHWDRGYIVKDSSGGERWSPGCEERGEKEKRLPDQCEKSNIVMEESCTLPQQQAPPPLPVVQNSANNTTTNRPRLPAGLGRSKVNPPGLQTLPRGRGPNSSTVILEGNHKSLPSCRREGPSVNGAQVAPPPRSSHPPPPPHEDRKMFLVPSEMVQVSQHGSITYTTVNSNNQQPPPQYSGNSSGNNPPPRPNDMSAGSSNVPYTPATAFLPHAHFPALRTTGFPSFPGGYMRPTFPFSPNGELVYQYHGPQTPPPPPPAQFIPTPVVTYSTVVPPPKLSCYNCGSQSHHASDCKENTMEEMTKQGQYRLDYSPYQKTGECSSEK